MATKRKSNLPKKKASKKPRFTARTADRHELYQLSVQASPYEVGVIERMYKRAFGRRAYTMREDFCGTALLCATWVESDVKRQATGVDFCAATLQWGLENNIEGLGKDAERVTLLREDVRAKRRGKFQVINALNFSYCTFRTRADLREYFESVHASLENQGLFICDLYGGWESQEPMLEPRKIAAGFTYIWDQDTFDPISHEVVNHIHFEFKDGTKIEKAFTYEWRYWSLPEIQELMHEAGFSEVRVYWDKSDDEDEEDYRITKCAENQPGWLAYIVGLR